MSSAGNANSASAVLGIKYAGTVSTNSLIVGCLKKIYGKKAWTALVDIFDFKERRAKHRTGSSRKFKAEELAQFLQSEDGFEFLVAVMADARPTWWRVCRPLMEVAETQKMQAAARRRLRRVIEGAVDADREISATIQRAEAALCVQDEDFYRPQFDAARNGAGPRDRAMAAPRRPR